MHQNRASQRTKKDKTDNAALASPVHAYLGYTDSQYCRFGQHTG